MFLSKTFYLPRFHNSSTAALVFLTAAAATGIVAFAARRRWLLTSSQGRSEKSKIQQRIVPPPKVTEATSFANFTQVFTSHAHLDLTVDFESKSIHGSVEYLLNRLVPQASLLILDTNNLVISDVYVLTNLDNIVPTKWKLRPKHAIYGSALEIQISPTCAKVLVKFETTQESTCLQFLSKNQTADKGHPFLFTQSQAIHARSFFPCQDCPAVKMTYTSIVHCPESLVAVMSAISKRNRKLGVFEFEQDVPISAYLVALVVGNLKSARLGARCQVWAEPSIIEKARDEFHDTSQFVNTAESLCGEYVWRRYDMVVLPPSFPYGGMENPCMTTLTPSLLAGDRSLIDVIVHEIMHSWSGNLITNATWSDFWMNEGFTVFCERKTIERLYGIERANLHRLIGRRELQDEITRLGENHAFTKLHIPMEEIDPDDSFSKVPYEKGAAFLEELERFVGGKDIFESFLQSYYAKFSHTVVTHEDFKNVFESRFGKFKDWNVWVHEPGFPIGQPPQTSKLAERAESSAQEWYVTEKMPQDCEKAMKLWSTSEKVLCLDWWSSKSPLKQSLLEQINSKWELHQVVNAEVKFRFLMLGLKGEKPVPKKTLDNVVEFLGLYGRMKYIRPLFRELGKVDMNLARRTFQQRRKELHSIAEKMVAKDLGVE